MCSFNYFAWNLKGLLPSNLRYVEKLSLNFFSCQVSLKSRFSFTMSINGSHTVLQVHVMGNFRNSLKLNTFLVNSVVLFDLSFSMILKLYIKHDCRTLLLRLWFNQSYYKYNRLDTQSNNSFTVMEAAGGFANLIHMNKTRGPATTIN